MRTRGAGEEGEHRPGMPSTWAGRKVVAPLESRGGWGERARRRKRTRRLGRGGWRRGRRGEKEVKAQKKKKEEVEKKKKKKVVVERVRKGG